LVVDDGKWFWVITVPHRLITPVAKQYRYEIEKMIPLLIRASGRTGTTLLLNLLKSSPKILVRGNYPFEERLLSYFYQLSAVPFTGQEATPGTPWTHESVNYSCSLIGRYPGTEPIASDVRVGQSRVIQALWQAYLNILADSGSNQFSFLAEKTGSDIAVINEWLYCKNIFLVRDPRDQLVSIREFDRKRGYKGFGLASEEGLGAINDLCDSLKNMYELAANIQVNEDRRLLVRYEDLVQNRDECLSRLGGWLGVSFDAVAFEHENLRYRSDHSTSENPTDSVGRWKHFLTDEEVSVFYEALGPFMAKLGYL